jgi:hypothetical protein
MAKVISRAIEAPEIENAYCAMNKSGKMGASAPLGGFWIEGLAHVAWVPNAKYRSHSCTLNKPLLLHWELVSAVVSRRHW